MKDAGGGRGQGFFVQNSGVQAQGLVLWKKRERGNNRLVKRIGILRKRCVIVSLKEKQLLERKVHPSHGQRCGGDSHKFKSKKGKRVKWGAQPENSQSSDVGNKREIN